MMDTMHSSEDTVGRLMALLPKPPAVQVRGDWDFFTSLDDEGEAGSFDYTDTLETQNENEQEERVDHEMGWKTDKHGWRSSGGSITTTEDSSSSRSSSVDSRECNEEEEKEEEDSNKEKEIAVSKDLKSEKSFLDKQHEVIRFEEEEEESKCEDLDLEEDLKKSGKTLRAVENYLVELLGKAYVTEHRGIINKLCIFGLLSGSLLYLSQPSQSQFTQGIKSVSLMVALMNVVSGALSSESGEEDSEDDPIHCSTAKHLFSLDENEEEVIL